MRYTSSGYIAIMTVLILLVFSLSLLLTVPYLSIGGAQQALVFAQSETTLAALQGCAEDALLLAMRNESYEGGNYTYFDTSCQVTIEKNDPLWTFSLSGSGYGMTRALQIVVERTPGSPGTLVLHSFLEQ